VSSNNVASISDTGIDLNYGLKSNSNNNGAPSTFLVKNSNSGSSAYSVINVGNDTADTLSMFLNSSTRTADGGINNGTLRNDAGKLILASKNGVSLMTLHTSASISFNIQTPGNPEILFRAYGNASSDFNFGPQIPSGFNTFLVVNQSNVGVFLTNGGTTWTSTSDIRMKRNISVMNKGLSFVNKLNPSYYNYLTDEVDANIRVGFIAQEVELILPDVVSIVKGKLYDDLRGLSMTDMIPYLVNSIKDLSNLIGPIGVPKMFNIQHPLKIDPKERLVHSSIEGPRCDLIYRGTKQLVNGVASVNIDVECTQNSNGNMTDGTFNALCTNAVYYLQNHGSFDRVKGSISGNILMITCENNTSSDLINWMVVAERKDKDIKDWNRTDENGMFITEYTEI
jgi:hypothetical protein